VSDLSSAVDLVLERATKRGDACDVLAVESERLEVGTRLGQTEKLKRSRERRLALRVFVGRSSAVVSTADLTSTALQAVVDDCVGLARSTAADPFAGLADVSGDTLPHADLELFDSSVADVTADQAIEVARVAETAALEADPRITNSEGAEFSAADRRLVFATSHGFRGEQRSSAFSLSVVPVARANGSMQRDYWYTSARHRVELEEASTVGRTAAVRALRRLGARAVPTRQVPVVFDPEMASSLVGHLAGAASGSSIYRGMSFLRERLGRRIAPAGVTLVDDPLRRRGLASRAFDAEGATSRTNRIVEDGVLQGFLLDSYSARKLGMSSTASAVRAIGEPPAAGPSNFYLAAGSASEREIIRSVRDGFYVTELIGSGVNPVTGDYSRGAAGLWIENGELVFPVEGVTIAGNLLDMLQAIEAVGDDLRFRASLSAPTLKIARMTVAGEA
jgi:PmbA protein